MSAEQSGGAKPENSDDCRKDTLDSGSPPPAGVQCPESSLACHSAPRRPRKRRKSGGPVPPIHGSGKIVILPSGDLSITESAERIFAALGAKGILFIVEVSVGEDGEMLVAVTRERFRSMLEEIGTVVRWGTKANGGWALYPTRCSNDTAEALLATKVARSVLPKIAFLYRSSIGEEDAGDLRILAEGYHDHHGIGCYITKCLPPKEVPIDGAVPALWALLDEFLFQSLGDCMRAMASFITPALHFAGLIGGPVPVDLALATEKGTGKTYRQLLVPEIYGEVAAQVPQRNKGVGSLEESIGERLLSGHPFIHLDNFSGPLACQYLEQLLTGKRTGARVCYQREVQVDPRRYLFSISSNDLKPTPDLVSRSVQIRQLKQPPGNKWKEFPEGDLAAHVSANQPFYLGCVFSVIREWMAAGRQRTSETRHRCRAWAQILDWIISNVMRGHAPLLSGYDVWGALTDQPDPKSLSESLGESENSLEEFFKDM